LYTRLKIARQTQRVLMRTWCDLEIKKTIW